MVTEPTEFSRETVVAMLKAYSDLRREKGGLERKIATLGKPIREYLEARRDEEYLWDGEYELRAYLEARAGADQLDTANCPDDLLRWLADHGCLNLDARALKALDGKFPETLRVRGYISPGPGSEALQVKEGRR